MNEVKLINVCRDVGQRLIEEYSSEGITCGINGPYDDPETKVRNLCHLIIITSIEIMRYGQEKYRKNLQAMGNELLKSRTEEGLFVMRSKMGKDISNGVIGHAWVIEGLVYLYKATKDNKYLEVSENIVKQHLFDEKLGLWNTPVYLLNKKVIDYTFNHQLWFAASMAELNIFLRNKDFDLQIKSFLNMLSKNFSISSGGRISHNIYNRLQIKDAIKQKIKKKMNFINEVVDKPSFKYKENGYHIFNLMAFARLYKIQGEHSFWKCDNIKKALQYTTTSKFKHELLNKKINLDNSLKNRIVCEEEKEINIYGYPYNVPGFEYPFIESVFNKIENSIKRNQSYYLEKQVELTWDEEFKMFCNHCHDKVTINYRVYELYRYLEVCL